MKTLIAVLFSAALTVLLAGHSPAQLNNSANRTHVQAVQAETPRKVSTLVTEQEKAPTEQQVEPKPDVQQQAKPVAQKLEGCEAYRSLVEKYDWNVNVAMAIMHAESGCSPTSLSPTRDRGLMQINAVHADMVGGDLSKLYDPATNISVAYRVYLSQGWRGWSVYKNGSYARFL